MLTSGGRTFKQRIAYAKALGQDGAWRVGGTWRRLVRLQQNERGGEREEGNIGEVGIQQVLKQQQVLLLLNWLVTGHWELTWQLPPPLCPTQPALPGPWSGMERRGRLSGGQGWGAHSLRAPRVRPPAQPPMK